MAPDPIDRRGFFALSGGALLCTLAGQEVATDEGQIDVEGLARGVKVPPKVAMAILRHTNLATTLEVYTHSLGEAEEEALELLGRYVGLFADGPDVRQSGPRGGTDGPPGDDA